MSKSPIAPEIQELVKKSVDRAVKRSINVIIKAQKEFDASKRDYFKETERLLYSLPALKLKVAQDEEDIQNGQMKLKERSRDIVCPIGGGGGGIQDTDTREEKYIQQRRESMERTKREIQRIERALETIQDDEYYDIIPLKYWDALPPVEIAERLNCDERTYYRHKNRLINKLKIILFGAEAL